MKFVLFSALCLVLTISAQAQPTAQRIGGFFADLHLNSATLKLDDASANAMDGHGRGVGVLVGYSFPRYVAFYIEGNGGRINPDDIDPRTDVVSYRPLHLDVGTQLMVDLGPWRPYIDIAFTKRSMEFFLNGLESGMSGTGITYGGGLRFFFAPALALNASLKITQGAFDKVDVGLTQQAIPAIDARSARLNIGLSWYLGR